MQNNNTNAVLSNTTLFELCEKCLYGPSSFSMHSSPAQCAPETMLCGFSLTNQVGIDYGFPYANPPEIPNSNSSFSSTFFSDFFELAISKQNQNDPKFWENIGQTAIASASFPIAFPPIFVNRTKEDYPYALAHSLSFLPGKIGYIDGGIFNNEPLKQALLLSKEQDGGIISEDRTFILIDPSITRSSQDLKSTQTQPLLQQIFRLLTLFSEQSKSRDWLKMGYINTKIEWQDNIINELPALINQLSSALLSSQLDSFQQQSQKILKERKKLISEEERKAFLEASFQRIRSRYKAPFGKIQDSEREKKQSLLTYMVFAITNASNLDTKFPVKFYAIASEESLTAGEPLFAFGGFFEERWREHDFRLGRNQTYKILPSILNISPYPKEQDKDYLYHNPFYDKEPSWKDLDKVTIADAPQEKRKQLLKLTLERAVLLVKSEPLNLSGIKLFIAKALFENVTRQALKLEKRTWYQPWTWFK